MIIKGRNCSLDYNLDKKWPKKYIPLLRDAIYVVGGLYGNYEALESIKEVVKEDNERFLVLNGDIHWFDIHEEDFLKIEEALYIPGCQLMLGNVEYELLAKDDTLGCGCNYSELVEDDFVMRSNLIHATMKRSLRNHTILEELKFRPRSKVYRLFDKRIAITHGDEKNMAGWKCSIDELAYKSRQEELLNWMNDNNIDILATTHTCLPALLRLGNKIIINNGAAGMANVKGETFGLISRIGDKPHSQALISEKIDDIYVELVKVDFSLDRFLEWFDKVWPEGSAASVSYRSRIINGTDLEIQDILIPNKLS